MQNSLDNDMHFLTRLVSQKSRLLYAVLTKLHISISVINLKTNTDNTVIKICKSKGGNNNIRLLNHKAL